MPNRRLVLALAAASLASLSGCGSTDESSTGAAATTGGDWPTAQAGQDPPTTLITVAPGTSLDSPGKGKLFFCPRPPVAPAFAASSTPWLQGTTIDVSKIAFVEGSVTWDSEFSMTTTPAGRVLKGNGLPNHPTGVFPIAKDTAAYGYYAALPAQGYDNAAEIPIAPYDIDLTLPLDPKPNPTPACVHWIFQGVVTQTGGAWHAELAPDTQYKPHDPISALPLDDCWGHPYMEQYHYHAYSWKCFPDQGEAGKHSPLFGYAIDGFGVYGPRGEGGELVTNDDLDECHGHTHEIDWDGEKKVMYHYHTNNEYPYTIGCYRGTPIDLPHHLQH